MNFFLSIRVKLFLSILLAILVSYTLLLFLTIHSIDASLENEIAKDLETNLGTVRYQLFTGLNKLRYVLQFPSSRPQVKDYMSRRNVRELAGVLNSIRQALPFLPYAAFVDRNGRVVAGLDEGQAGRPHPFDGLVTVAFRKHETVISCELADRRLFCGKGEPCGDAKTGTEILTAAVAFPIVDQAGELLGGLVAAVPITINNAVPGQIRKNLGHDLEAGITHGDLRIISGSDENVVISRTDSENILSELRKGKRSRGSVLINRTLYSAAFEPITSLDGRLIGSLWVALPKEHFSSVRSGYFNGITTSAVFTVLLSFIIAYFAARRLTIPLKELAKGVRCVEQGNLDFRVEINATGEFATLADSFNRMADALRERGATIRSKTLDLEVLNRCLHEMNELLESNVRERTAELEMEKGRLEAILSSMAEGMVVTDRENRVILFNSAAQKIFGIAPYKVVSRHVDEIDLKGGFHQLIESIREMRTGDHLTQGEKEVTVGRKKLRVSLSPLLDKSWEFAGIVMSIRDVTREEEVDRMKTEFISTVSHELKTPLTSMKGSLQVILARGEGLSDTERELLQVCLRNTDRLIRLISDILDISRIESGRVEISMKAVPTALVVSHAVEEIAAYARDHGVSVASSVADGLPPVLGDYDSLIQVLTNLLSNAVKFSPAGNSVTVSALQAGEFIEVTVHDQGKAIEKGDREKLFQRFPQLVGTDARERGGTGLGLAICREIIERHHGRIFYQPAQGGGNIFGFTVRVCGEG